jgi:hypothetical protein
MSRVFSFRLDENNPREAQAIQILQTWANQGYSLRYVIIMALLALTDKNKQSDISTELKQIISLLQDLQGQTSVERPQQDQEKSLSESFKNAIAKVNRPGLRVD